MSHFTHIKTRFQNLFYLEKALNRLNISHTEEQEKSVQNTTSYHKSLIISQSNGYDIKFVWNGKEYELIVDISFWEQSYPVENFMNIVSQQYASEIIVNESEETGFYPTRFKHHVDGSSTLILERWNNKSGS